VFLALQTWTHLLSIVGAEALPPPAIALLRKERKEGYAGML